MVQLTFNEPILGSLFILIQQWSAFAFMVRLFIHDTVLKTLAKNVQDLVVNHSGNKRSFVGAMFSVVYNYNTFALRTIDSRRLMHDYCLIITNSIIEKH